MVETICKWVFGAKNWTLLLDGHAAVPVEPEFVIWVGVLDLWMTTPPTLEATERGGVGDG
jgi:hypothetical protein